jgi:hypothetical protein
MANKLLIIQYLFVESTCVSRVAHPTIADTFFADFVWRLIGQQGQSR